MLQVELKDPTCVDCKKTMTREAVEDNKVQHACNNCQTILVMEFKMIKNKKFPRTRLKVDTVRNGSNVKTVAVMKVLKTVTKKAEKKTT